MGTSDQKQKVSLFRIVFSFLLFPIMVVIVIPCLLSLNAHQLFTQNIFRFPAQKLAAGFLVSSGLTLLVITNIAFIRIGNGTLAPWDPPKNLVVSGPYKYVCQPMIIGVLLILFGEIFLFGSQGSIAWFTFYLIANLIYPPLSEEKALIKRFGDAFREYQKNVPAWIPRCKPWIPPKEK